MNISEDFSNSTTLADSVAESILQYVKRERLAPGDLLPKEEEIASQLNVSRHIVREGISGLKTLGIIESRKRKGMFIRRRLNAFESVKKLASAQLFSAEESRQFMQIRVIMEMGMANFIWKNRTAKNISELRSIVNHSELPSIQNEIDFHSRLFSIGGNDIANQFQSILISAFKPESTLSPLACEKYIPSHLEICDELENGTKAGFSDIMEKHFKPYL